MNDLIPKVASNTHIAILLFLALAASSFWFFSCSTTSKDIRNVILISIDTCRADYLSCYGYPKQTTPNIDELSQESILFTNVYTTVPLTLPAHSSMLTGTIPPHHGVHDNLKYKLDQSNITLAEILGCNKFSTAAVVSSHILNSKFGIKQGFDYYYDHFDKPINEKDLDINERKGEDTNHIAFEWLDKHKDERFFLFLHYYDPHHYYEPPEPFLSRFSEDLYAGEIAYTDFCIGQIIAKLKNLGLYDSSLIIITSDHGEMLGEHGEDTHSYFIYQSALKVPMIFKLPGHYKAAKIDDPVGLIDILPTICSLLEIQEPSNIQGKNLAPFFYGKQGTSPERYFYCESLFPTRYKLNSLLSVATYGWKYIQTTRPELYDLVSDPGETRNLIKQQPNRARILKDRLKQILENSVRKDNSGSKAAMNEKEKRKLESLGYLASTSISEDFEFDQTKVDPKDLIGFHRLILKGIKLIHRNQLAKAKVLYETMLKEYPPHPETHYRLAGIASKQNDLDKAVKHLNAAIRINPEDSVIQLCLASVLAKQGRLDEALNHFDKGLQIDQDNASAHNNMAIIFRSQGKIKKAIYHFNAAIRIDPDNTISHKYLGDIMKRQGNIDDAIVHYGTAIKLDPDFREAQISLGEAHFVMGNIFVGKGEINEAIDHFQKSLQLNYNFAKAHTNLGYALLTQGKEDEALKHFLEAIRIDPENSINAYYNLACIYAIKNNIDESTDWLKKAIDKGFNNWDTLETDEDLKNIRATGYFIEIMKKNR